jgi:hypothetical protein
MCNFGGSGRSVDVNRRNIRRSLRGNGRRFDENRKSVDEKRKSVDKSGRRFSDKYVLYFF